MRIKIENQEAHPMLAVVKRAADEIVKLVDKECEQYSNDNKLRYMLMVEILINACGNSIYRHTNKNKIAQVADIFMDKMHEWFEMLCADIVINGDGKNKNDR